MVVPSVINLETARSPVDDREVSVSFDINELPARILVSTYVPPFETVRYVPEHRATHVVRAHGATGRCSCSGCGISISPYDRFCRNCGAKLSGTEYVEDDA